jgi:hypothetical protein
MAKLKTDPIVEADLTEYLETSSDFGFEIKCLKQLTGDGFTCRHGGLYTDPITKKKRQFDIRAMKEFGLSRVFCAVECKNLKDNSPLLISCVPRPRRESFHELIISDINTPRPFPLLDSEGDNIESFSIYREASSLAYKPDAAVGKECAHVGRLLDNTFSSKDTEIYDAWSQAIHSADGLITLASIPNREKKTNYVSIVLPILVVPRGTLWQVVFDDDGTMVKYPEQVDRCPFFIDRKYEPSGVTLLNLEIVTLVGLKSLCQEALEIDGPWFPSRALTSAQ